MEAIMQVLGRAVRRGGVFLVGMTLLIAGAAMLVLPGPGIAVMLLGLVVLSAEFLWAKRVLAWARERFGTIKDQAQSRWPGSNRNPPSGPPTRDRPDQAA
ncbi:MAG TPA: PGPGW domain-containing protein [Actinomycetes bacterium]|nr:PGPGW domain-containing protein [Actinomycetota bacterium]HEX2157334.1 PGPGW domain-containing protein [Actinomycetes bacterium]